MVDLEMKYQIKYDYMFQFVLILYYIILCFGNITLHRILIFEFGRDYPEPQQLERVLCFASASRTSGRIK